MDNKQFISILSPFSPHFLLPDKQCFLEEENTHLLDVQIHKVHVENQLE